MKYNQMPKHSRNATDVGLHHGIAFHKLLSSVSIQHKSTQRKKKPEKIKFFIHWCNLLSQSSHFSWHTVIYSVMVTCSWTHFPQQEVCCRPWAPIDQYNPDLYFSTVGKKNMSSLFQRLKVFVQQYEILSRSIIYPCGFRENALPCLWKNSWMEKKKSPSNLSFWQQGQPFIIALMLSITFS